MTIATTARAAKALESSTRECAPCKVATEHCYTVLRQRSSAIWACCDSARAGYPVASGACRAHGAIDRAIRVTRLRHDRGRACGSDAHKVRPTIGSGSRAHACQPEEVGSPIMRVVTRVHPLELPCAACRELSRCLRIRACTSRRVCIVRQLDHVRICSGARQGWTIMVGCERRHQQGGARKLEVLNCAQLLKLKTRCWYAVWHPPPQWVWKTVIST